jgi:alanyl-tRNA synthetase
MGMDANRLRRAFTGFFAERGHTVVPSSGLIPQDPSVLFTIAGMVQFKPYFVGDEATPYPRATSVQKCFRTVDIDIVGTTARHCTFFEMLGNFSFGDYFKDVAIPYAWELCTEVLGLDPDRLWITCHHDDDEAADIWRQAVGVPAERIQRMGEDNFWEMAKGGAGPCGPSSEIYFDKGPEHGEEGGPAGGGPERYVEIWNLVFMQYSRGPDGTLADLPRKNIDTGAGLERILPILQGTESVFETDVLRPVVAAAEATTGRRYGDDPQADVSLRIMADHGRAMTFLVNDGVFPSNEDRGYVLRRVIRRAVRHAFQLGVDRPVVPSLVESTVDVMGEAYPDLVRNQDFVTGVVSREEERFRQTLRAGSNILEEELARGGGRVSGEVAFRLHDTFGFPVEITREIAAERSLDVDLEGFEASMAEQRKRAKEARRAADESGVPIGAYREVLDQFGTTEFTGYREHGTTARVVAVLGDEVFLDRSPFYAEAGGQVGDTGTVTTATGTARVVDTTYALPGLHRHKTHVLEGRISSGQEAEARIDAERREAIRRNHTGTHLLHWALREVLGDHVKQAGSLVAPDRLRFDFSHYGPVTPHELEKVEVLVNEGVLSNEPVRAYETSREEAERVGAIAFFGEKYGDIVRVVEAGSRSFELCGGTHVGALGMIGPIKIVSEGSIGANMRRIEALTGMTALERIREEEGLLERVATLLRVTPDEVPERVQRELQGRRALEKELEDLRRQAAAGEAAALAAGAAGGVVVARRDVPRDRLRDLALLVRDQRGVRAVVLGGTPPAGGVALVAAVAPDSGLVASDLVTGPARTVGGGGGKGAEVATAGGRDGARLDEALEQARAALSPV